MLALSILDTIGNTPHVRINRLFNSQIEVWLKLERTNPGASLKDRIALSMIEEAEAKGILSRGATIIEPTSGNTGIGLAIVSAVKGYNLILVMPESMSVERRRYLAALGAKIVLTPKELGMTGAVNKAKELLETTKNAWIPNQFENPANPEIHKHTTAREIINDFSNGLDIFITGVGTGGHITGCAKVLKEKWPKLKVFAVEPEDSAVLSGQKPCMHQIQGIGAGFIPKVLDTSVIDDIIKITKEEAFSFTARCAKEEGIFVGISTGASLAAIEKVFREKKCHTLQKNKILTFCYDTGERYLSVEGLFEVS